MGPIVLFDKSFLQSLSLDESVWFSNFFNPIVCPLFYIETLADLAKTSKDGKRSEEIVKRIAQKFPETSGSPCTFHLDLSLMNLLGSQVPMKRGIPLQGGKLVKSGKKSGVVYEITPEQDAFNRWMTGNFSEIERNYAKEWRTKLSNLDLSSFSSELQKLGIDTKSCKTHNQAKLIAENIIYGEDKIFERMHLICLLLRIPERLIHNIFVSWNSVGNMPIGRYAPYAAYVATIELFLHILIASKIESGERASHSIDIAYLAYLPFCDFFVSNDKLHSRCAPLFLKEPQQFVKGIELKKGLKQVDEYYDELPLLEKERGINSFAKTPPKEGSFFISKIWDHYFLDWRTKKEIDETKIDSKIAEEIINIANAPSINPEEMDFDPQNPDTLTLKRITRKRKGKWYQLPKDFDPNKKR